MTSTLIIFARLPVVGEVKTRLAAGVGPDDACVFYKACAEKVIACCSRCPSTRPVVYHSSGCNTQQVREWLASFMQEVPETQPQAPGTDLGAKLHQALSHELTRPGVRKALVVGTDIPDLDGEVVTAAARALDEYEMVIGPAADGGYYLLGLTAPPEEGLFKGILWSTPSVLRDSLARAHEAGLRVAPLDTLPRLQDVDTLQDLQSWHAGWSSCDDNSSSSSAAASGGVLAPTPPAGYVTWVHQGSAAGPSRHQRHPPTQPSASYSGQDLDSSCCCEALCASLKGAVESILQKALVTCPPHADDPHLPGQG